MTAQQVQLLTDILDQIVVPLVGAVAAWAIARWGLRQRAEQLLARGDLIGWAARTATAAIEQQLSGQAGAVKKQAAVGAAIALLHAHGVPVTQDQETAIETAIEAEVLALKRAAPAPPPAPPAITPATRRAAAPQGGLGA